MRLLLLVVPAVGLLVAVGVLQYWLLRKKIGERDKKEGDINVNDNRATSDGVMSTSWVIL